VQIREALPLRRSQPGLLAQRFDVAHRQPAHERADDNAVQRLGAQQLVPRGNSREQTARPPRGLRNLDRQLAPRRSAASRPEPVAHPADSLSAALVARAAQPRVELLLDRALDDQNRAPSLAAATDAARGSSRPDGQQPIDLSSISADGGTGASHA